MARIYNLQTFSVRRKFLRKRSTPEEKILWDRLRNRNFKWKIRRQFSIGGYIADFYCPEKRVVIELDGKSHFTEEGKEYDEERSNHFSGLGIRVLRFTNKEINTDIENVISRII